MGWRLAEFRTLDRFRSPRTFNPTLTFPEACVAVAGALTRIFLGSLLFAICGAYTWSAWATIHSPWWRAVAVILWSLTFLVSFAALLLGVQAAVNGMLRRLKGRGVAGA